MRLRFSAAIWLSLCLAWPLALAAQTDEPSLGDLARSLRNHRPQPERPVIDNDNLAQAMEDAKKLKFADRLVFSVDASGKNFNVSSPDVTCSLSFNAHAASLLIKPVLVEEVPVAELLKLDGPASIDDDNLQLEVFNGTDWELREITVGLTLERKPGESAEMAATARVIPAAQGLAPAAIEKHSDVTMLFHLKGTAKPFTTTAFRENIGLTPAPDQDWRWSIVEAKGIRQADSANAEQTPASQIPRGSRVAPELQLSPEQAPASAAPMPLPKPMPAPSATPLPNAEPTAKPLPNPAPR